MAALFLHIRSEPKTQHWEWSLPAWAGPPWWCSPSHVMGLLHAGKQRNSSYAFWWFIHIFSVRLSVKDFSYKILFKHFSDSIALVLQPWEMLFLPCYVQKQDLFQSPGEPQVQRQPMLRFLLFKLCRWLDNLTTGTVLKCICNTKPLRLTQEHPLRPGQRQELNTHFLYPISLPSFWYYD